MKTRPTPTRKKYEIIEVQTTEVCVDVSMLRKTEDLFFNATEIAKQFGKRTNDFLRLDSTKEYIDALAECNSQNGISRSEEYVRVQNGGKHRGTWLHRDLALEFAGWLSASFRVHLHKWAEARIDEERHRKAIRDELRTGYRPLTDAIQKAHDPAKPYHFSNEADLINRIVLGMSAKQYREQHGVDDVRDHCDARQAYMLDQLQRMNAALIALGWDYPQAEGGVGAVCSAGGYGCQ